MRFLLISDTHGRLGGIEELATRVRADAVIHAGGFGYFENGSVERIVTLHIHLMPSFQIR
jgi:predicted phosphodiesterase